MTNSIVFSGIGYTHSHLTALSGPELLSLHNAIAAELELSPVKRFADRRAAIKRTWKALEDYYLLKNNEGTKEPIDPAPAEAAPAVKLVQSRTVEGASVLVKAEKPKQKVERWRTPKRREPSKRCYRPRAGSKQAKAYLLLTAEGGIRVEDFCSQMAALDTSGKNSTEWKEPGTIWGSLNYLFVTQKGYGLDFDGERIRLLVGEEEVEAPSGGKVA